MTIKFDLATRLSVAGTYGGCCKSMEVKLEAYEGSLDLLLTLIQRHKIDIYDIPIAHLTDQYLQEVAKLPPDMGQLSEFLVMAATLLEIKSKMLLPKAKIEQAEEAEDPREALVQKLLAYKQAQAIADELRKITPKGERLPGIGDMPLLAQIKEDGNVAPVLDTEQVPINQLFDIFADIMARKEERRDKVRAGYGKMPRDAFTVEEKVALMRKMIEEAGELRLRALFLACQSKKEMVVTFLAILEMVRQGEVTASQPETFGDAIISKKIM